MYPSARWLPSGSCDAVRPIASRERQPGRLARPAWEPDQQALLAWTECLVVLVWQSAPDQAEPATGSGTFVDPYRAFPQRMDSLNWCGASRLPRLPLVTKAVPRNPADFGRASLGSTPAAANCSLVGTPV